MDYHDYAEMRAVLRELHADANAKGETLGWSADYTHGTPVKYPILALRVFGNTPVESEIVDKGDARPSILFDAGIHGREWLTSESLIELAKYLVAEAKDPKSRVSRALSRVDVWIIPMDNPAGRVVDDLGGGDPRRFFTSSAKETGQGWRGNGDTRVGAHGVDVGRNFSRDWNRANSEPNGGQWRGIAPFCSTEATAMRQFVQNRYIGMAVHLHTTAQAVWNIWGNDDRAGTVMRRRVCETWMEGCRTFAVSLGKPVEQFHLQLEELGLGTSSGQFSAWLASPSDTAGQPDFGTARGIQTLLIELPFNNPKHKNYYGALVQHSVKDGSNSFRPSAAVVRSLLRDAFIPTALYLIEQAAAPCCATRANGSAGETTEPNGFVPGDFGILAAKISTEAGTPGAIRSYPATESLDRGRIVVTPAQDYVESGQYFVYYWGQNYGASRSDCVVGVCVQLRPQGRESPWKTIATITRPLGSLGPREKRLDRAPIHVRSSYEYQVTIEIKSPQDQFAKNNRKAFRFVGTSELPEFRHDCVSRSQHEK